MMLFYNHDMSWWGYTGMGIGMVLFWALIIGGIVAVLRVSTADHSRPTPPPQPHTPEQVLAQRFANGEISEAEYRDRLAVLREHTRA